ncbi:MAG: hypothetical protein S4CHLAM2_17190 [Chlamydiales bacterium]|nr:hypothetical protein [Chlamydiales bacterium]
MSNLSLERVGSCGAAASGIVGVGGWLTGATVCMPVAVSAAGVSLFCLGLSYVFPPPDQPRVDNRNLQQAAANDEAAEAVAGAAQEAAERIAELERQLETLARQLIESNRKLGILQGKYDGQKIVCEKLAIQLRDEKEARAELQKKYDKLKIQCAQLAKTVIASKQKTPKQEQADRRVSAAAQDALPTKAG